MHFQLAISRFKKSQKMSEFWPTGISNRWAFSRLKKSQKMSEFARPVVSGSRFDSGAVGSLKWSMTQNVKKLFYEMLCTYFLTSELWWVANLVAMGGLHTPMVSIYVCPNFCKHWIQKCEDLNFLVMTIVWLGNKCFFPLTRGGGKKNLNFGLHGLVIDGLLASLESRRKCANFGL